MQCLKHSGSIHGAGAITENFMWEELWYILNIMHVKSSDVHWNIRFYALISAMPLMLWV